MTFVNPIFFWALLSLLPLIAIYLLKVKPTRKPTTAYFLWQEIFQEKRSTALFQRLRDLFSLLLMLLAFVAISLALTKPIWTDDERLDLVLLIDNSASMNADNGNETRLESAKKTASQIVESLDGTQRCSVATVNSDIQFVSNMTDNPRELLNAIDSITPTSLPSRMLALQSLSDNSSRSTVSNRDNKSSEDSSTTDSNPTFSDDDSKHRFVFLSDGVVDGPIPDSMELLKIGEKPTGNIGIVACDMQRLIGTGRAGVFYQIISTFKEPVEAELILTHQSPDNIVKLIPLTIAPGSNPSAVFELENAEPGHWQISLDIDDGLNDDNQVDLILPAINPIQVGVAGTDRFFYENSVIAFSNTGGLLKLVPTGGQLLIGQKSIPLQADGADLLIFQPDGESPWWSSVGEAIDVALPRAIDENHPAIRHIDISSIPFVGAKRLELPPGADVWVEAEDKTPLIYKITRSGTSVVIVNLDPLDSNFYFSAWFPVLVYSTAKHLAGRTDTIKSTYATGEATAIPGANGENASNLVFPDGSSITTAATRTPALTVRGVYELENDQVRTLLAYSLLSEPESNIDNGNVTDTSKPISRGTSLVGILTILAIVVVLAESILYQLRKVG